MTEIFTSSGRTIDLTEDSKVHDIPAESLNISKRSFGLFGRSETFSVQLKNYDYILNREFLGQFFYRDEGLTILKKEIAMMHEFFPLQDIFLKQDKLTGDVSFYIIHWYHGVEHDILLTYSQIHPLSEMRAKILKPKLDSHRMGHHAFSANEPCYIDHWTREMNAFKTIYQIFYWLDDYYNGSLTGQRNNMSGVVDVNRMMSEIQNLIGQNTRSFAS
ncbi:MAG: hypothetical protein WD717_06440 [Nitrosarchaeum sp.]